MTLPRLLTHELNPTPPALSTTDGQLRVTNKSSLLSLIAAPHELNELPTPTTNDKICVILDGMALVQAIGKPCKARNFGDLADIFSLVVTNNFKDNNCNRIDVDFDRYDSKSVKSATRSKRNNKANKIRRLVDRRELTLPTSWPNCISMEENKQNLIQFLTSEVLKKTRGLTGNKEVIIAGGYDDPKEVISSIGNSSIPPSLFSSYDEADTRMILHVLNANASGYKNIVVQSGDTDVLVLLVHHQHRCSANVWMSSGTSKKHTFIPIHNLIQSLSPAVIAALLAYRALTGCDTTSQFSGFEKKTTWKTFIAHPNLLLPTSETGRFKLLEAEQFVIKLYSPSSAAVNVNALRAEMFHKVTDLEKLPPTKDALAQHLLRSQYQSMVWCCAHIALPDIPSLEGYGWKYEKYRMQPILMTCEPMPTSCPELSTCKCISSKCSSSRCSCVKSMIGCSLGCQCTMTCLNPNNFTIAVNDDSDVESD